MNDEFTVNELAEGARSVARARSAADVFRALLESSRVTAPRAAVFLVRQGAMHGWGSFGYGTDVAQTQRSYHDEGQGWLGEVAASEDGGPTPCRDLSTAPEFGQPKATETVGCAVRIDDRPIAVVVAERGMGESPWVPDGLALLTGVAELALKVVLARRHAGEPRRETVVSAPETEPVAAESTPDLEQARRYARLVATDIRLYNEEAVMLGRRNGDLTDRIGEHLSRGKETFMRRHAELGPTGIELLHEAYIQVLAAGDAALIPASLLD
jgi:hypothetical protein